MKRTWSLCESRQLEHLLQSSQSATAAVAAAVQRQAPEHFVQASVEARSLIGGVHESNKRSNNTNNNGRALQDAIVLAENEINNNESDDINSNDGGVENPSLCSASDLTTNASALQAPICLTEKRDAPNTSSNNNATTTTGTSPEPCLLLGSSETERTAAAYLRKYLSLREQCFAESKQIRLLNRSLQHQQVVMNTLAHQRAELPARSLQQQPVAEDNVAVAVVAQLEEIRKAELSCERVVSQIMRQLPTLEKNYQTTSRDLISARLLARKSFDHSKSMIRRFRDPVVNIRKESSLQNRTLMNLCNRQCGFDRSIYRRGLLSAGRIRACGVVAEDRKALLYNRFSHAATINTHLSYPVYCLRFDRTGRYFVSGADDYLAKVFCLAGSVVGKRHDRLGHVAHPHGAVLVCTLKGHAGVINDIGVSSDNCFLATASADGDCRVWGLKDGCPVAILRGHLDGANMVR